MPVPAESIEQTLFTPRGNAMWDGLLRGSGVAGLVGILAAIFAGPLVAGLVGFVVVTVWVNGPLGIFMPATFEPILMLMGRLYPPPVIAATAIIGLMYVELLNYHLYAKALRARAFEPIRDHALVRRIVLPLFRRAPFLTVWLCSWSPLPYWSVRILAPLEGYSISRYLTATFLGRFPRFWFFATLGGLPVLQGKILPFTMLAVLLALLFIFAAPLWKSVRSLVARSAEVEHLSGVRVEAVQQGDAGQAEMAL